PEAPQRLAEVAGIEHDEHVAEHRGNDKEHDRRLQPYRGNQEWQSTRRVAKTGRALDDTSQQQAERGKRKGYRLCPVHFCPEILMTLVASGRITRPVGCLMPGARPRPSSQLLSVVATEPRG